VVSPAVATLDAENADDAEDFSSVGGAGMAMRDLLHRDTTAAITDAFYRVYRTLGHGFLESVYRNALAVELGRMGKQVRREFPAEVLHEGVSVGTFRFDLLVDFRVIVEVKCAAVLPPIDRKQLLNYLKASEFEVGMLLNFGATPEFKRLVYSNSAKQGFPR
jgi:GxxExxY protein